MLTQKHIIVFYSGGRSEWLAKFYPELLDEDTLVRPFQLDRFHDSPRRPLHAVYDHQLQRLLLAYEDGFLGVLGVAAETNKAEEEEDEQEGRKKVREARRVEVEGSLVGPYHRAPLLLLREIAGTSLVVSVSADGRVVLWSGKQRRQVGFFDAEGPLTCADLNGKANVLAVGRQDGLVQFYSVSSFDTPFLFREFRLTRGSRLDHLAFSSSSDQLAVLSRAEDRIYYLLTALAMPFEVLGYVVLPHKPLSFAWHITTRVAVKPKHEHLLVCVGFGVLMVNGPAAVPAKRRGEELALQAEIFAARTDPDQHLVVSLPSGEILTTGDDKLIKKYRQPEEPLSKVDFRSKTPLPLPLEELDGHDLRITTWQLSGKWLVSGSADGSVQVRDTGALGQVRTCRALGWKEESVGAVGVGSNGWVLVGSRTGCLQVWKGEGEAGSDEHKVEEAAFRRVGKERETKYFEVMVEEEYLERMKEVISGKKKVQLEKLARIRAELGELLAENARHDELERLGRDEFAIDLESRERVAQVGRE